MNDNEIGDLIPLDESTNKLAQDIIKEQDIDNIKNLMHLFNVSQAKKNVLRVLKLNDLLDKVQDQMVERFEKKPGEFSNADLLNYMQVAQQAIDRANKSLTLVDETPAITMNQLNVSISGQDTDTLSRESREKVTEAINNIMKKLKLNEQEHDDVVEIAESSSAEIIASDDESSNKLLNEEE